MGKCLTLDSCGYLRTPKCLRPHISELCGERVLVYYECVRCKLKLLNINKYSTGTGTLQNYIHYHLHNDTNLIGVFIEKFLQHFDKSGRYPSPSKHTAATQFNSTSIYGRRCKHLNVRIYLTQLNAKIH